MTLRQAPGPALDAVTLYALLRLRVDVFVVEQRCPYPELDGRDLAPGCVHWWVEGPTGDVLACLRVVTEPDGPWRVGRVATAAHARGAGHAGRLLDAALEQTGRPVVLHAQSHLRGWYARRGFAVTGPEFVEDGIPHVPMRLER